MPGSSLRAGDKPYPALVSAVPMAAMGRMASTGQKRTVEESLHGQNCRIKQVLSYVVEKFSTNLSEGVLTQAPHTPIPALLRNRPTCHLPDQDETSLQR